ncbi:hypothetical protein LCGC14_2551290 [marine sediment metagenome]|uniref:Uncharacterized protein n=1 Tax=marine sediment metagenome TaxID=412755 RepID=A0A0F9AND8_9ZZZZ
MFTLTLDLDLTDIPCRTCSHPRSAHERVGLGDKATYSCHHCFEMEDGEHHSDVDWIHDYVAAV